MEIRIYDHPGPTAQLVFGPLAVYKPIVLCRGESAAERPHQVIPAPDHAAHPRLIVAEFTETKIGRSHLLVEPLPGERVRLTNTSTKSTVQVKAEDLPIRVMREYDLPADGLTVVLGHIVLIGLLPTARRVSHLQYESVAPVVGPAAGRPDHLRLWRDYHLDPDAMAVLDSVVDVLQSALGADDFFNRAARAVVSGTQMDTGHVLLWEGDTWKVRESVTSTAGEPARSEGDAGPPSHEVLSRVRAQKTTVWEQPDRSAGSLAGVRAVIATPILDRGGEVIGALYGDRRQDGPPITEANAKFVHLIAWALSNGLERMRQEETIRRYEPFFPPVLARKLIEQPNLLAARRAEVTLLFADVRHFSGISEKVGPQITMEWIADVMEELSACVAAEGGVLVDYIGDELVAMWGAPDEQPDHPNRAVRAARAMLGRREELDRRWLARLGEGIEFGIGINTGEAFVGNTGSTRRFKYGPLGNTVNLASRVQGATKHLRARLLVTEATYDHLPPDLQGQARQLSQIKVINIAEPVTLYEVAPDGPEPCPGWKDVYENALTKFANENFRVAASELIPLCVLPHDDGPSIALLARAVQALAHGAPPGHPVLVLDSK